MKILIVDDDYMVREILQAHMEHAHFQVLMANSGEKALVLAASSQPDVILMDVNMPGIDGYAACVRLKETETTCHIPVLLMTAMDDDETIALAVRSGADGFVAKPYNFQNIIEQINAVVH